MTATTATTTRAPSDVAVPLLDLKAQYATIREEVEDAIRGVVESQWFILGPEVAAFEEEIARYIDVEYAIGCSSGSDAILLALMALGIGPGQSVLCPSYTFFATAGSVSRLGATPVFVDIEPTTYNADIELAREAAKNAKNLAAIMPVHLFGQTVDMTAWLALANEFGVPLIEDAAQAIGARDDKGAMAGSRGALGCFSFFPSKNLGGFGEGGLVTTNDGELAQKLREMRVHGMEPKYIHKHIGVNGRLDALQAAVLRVKLRHLEGWHDGRAHNAADYDRMFAEAGARVSGTPFEEGEAMPIRTPAPAAEPFRHIYNQYVIRVPAAIREPLREHLRSVNIGHEVYYPVPLHRQACYADLGIAEGSLPESEWAAKETLALPIYPELTAEQRSRVAQVIVEFVASQTRA
ncbi:MAG: transcriptional regulator [Phycisphaerae bacterium]|nr:transcriptional regulator [Phycisphaerae bacterium]